MRLLLVRHGESICGVNGIVGGEKGCTGLTERGFAQARSLRDRFVREGFRPDVVYASTLPRAAQTAETIAEGLGVPVAREPDLCEFIPGEIDGTLWKDFAGFDVVAEPDRPVSAGGESLTVFRGRIESVLGRLADDHGGRTVVAVCHGGPIYASLHLLLGLPSDIRVSADVDFTSVTEFRLDEGGWRLVRFNDCAHLGADLLAPSEA